MTAASTIPCAGPPRARLRARGVFLAGCIIAASYLLAPLILPVVLPMAPPLGAAEWLGPLWKATGIILFGVFAFTNGARLFGLGLLASAAGDWVLALTPPAWIGGMAAFGLAHVLYCAAFLGVLRQKGAAPGSGVLAAGALIGMGAAYVWLLPGMGTLLVPGTTYNVIIAAMLTLALMARAPLSAKAGALLFVASDSVLALELYRGMGPFGPLNWTLYAGAQALLAAGMATHARGPGPIASEKAAG